MLREITLGLIAAASPHHAAPARLPPGIHGHRGHGWHGYGLGFGGLYIDTGVSDCCSSSGFQTRSRHAPAHGERLRLLDAR